MTVETQECPKCGGWVEPEEGPAAAAFKLFLMGLCLVWIPVIGWVMGPILILFGGLGCLAVIVPQGSFDFKCKSCKKKWRLKKAELVTT